MSDLDKRAQALMKNIDVLADEFLRNLKTLTSDQKKEQLDKIQNMFNKAKVWEYNIVITTILKLYK